MLLHRSTDTRSHQINSPVIDTGLGALPETLQFICEGTATVGGVAKAVGGVGISGGGSGGKS